MDMQIKYAEENSSNVTFLVRSMDFLKQRMILPMQQDSWPEPISYRTVKSLTKICSSW